MRARLAGLALGLGLGVLLLPTPARADGAAVDEYALKAAFLFNFTRFVEWPDDAFESVDSPFRICVLGTDPFGPRLEALTNRRVGARPIVIERPIATAALARCHIAYFSEDSAAALRDAPPPRALTVSSGRGFAREGGMVALVTGRGRVQLHVNLASIQRSPLKFSAKLLEVADVRHDRIRVRE
ncbi:MAG: YfiR family protein [Silanimonas sp.]